MLTEAQKSMHANGIGGSEAAPAVGISPYKTPLELYLEKVTPELDDEREAAITPAARERMHFGTILEDIVAKEYSRRTGAKVRRKTAAVVAKDQAFMFAHLDREVLNVGGRILECKTAGAYAKGAWGEDWSDEYPDDYRVQVHHQMICAGIHSAHLAVLIGGNDFRMYDVEYDEELADAIVFYEQEFWKCVTEQTPPPPRTLNDLSLLYPQATHEQKLIDSETLAEVQNLANMKRIKKQLEDDIDEVAYTVKKYMGDAELLVDLDGNALYTRKNRKGAKKFNAKEFAKDNPEMYEAYRVDGNPSRAFIVK